MESHEMWEVLAPPVFGKYDDYGCLDHIQPSLVSQYLLRYFAEQHGLGLSKPADLFRYLYHESGNLVFVRTGKNGGPGQHLHYPEYFMKKNGETSIILFSRIGYRKKKGGFRRDTSYRKNHFVSSLPETESGMRVQWGRSDQ